MPRGGCAAGEQLQGLRDGVSLQLGSSLLQLRPSSWDPLPGPSASEVYLLFTASG